MPKKLVMTLLAWCLLLSPAIAQDHPDRSSVITQAKADLLATGQDLAGPCGALSIVKLAAWRMRAEGAGLLDKPTGNNCQGLATDIIAYPDGRIYDVLIASGGTVGTPGDLTGNHPAWQDDGTVAVNRYRAVTEPVIPPAPTPVPTPIPVPVPVPVPVPAPLPSTDILVQLASLSAQLQQCLTGIAQVDQNVTAGRQENQTFFARVKSVWQQVGGPILKYVLPAITAFLAGKTL